MSECHSVYRASCCRLIKTAENIIAEERLLPEFKPLHEEIVVSLQEFCSLTEEAEKGIIRLSELKKAADDLAFYCASAETLLSATDRSDPVWRLCRALFAKI